MKRILTLLLMLAGLAAAAQNSPKYEQFKELRDKADTLGMMRMLDEWGDKDPEYYSAWANYCQVMAEETEEESWMPMSVNWVRMGREEFPDNELLHHKLAEVLFGADYNEEAFTVLKEIEERGIADASTWRLLAGCCLMSNDLDKVRKYLSLLIRDGDEEDREFARESLEAVDKTDSLRNSQLLRLDHDALRKQAETPEFPQLIARFEACDSTLTREEIASVYYGSAYLKDYNLVSRNSQDIEQLAEEEKFDEASAALREKLKEYPVSLFLIVSLYNLSEDEQESQACAWKANALLGTIDSSGRCTPEKPLQVICVNDEYMALGHIFEMQDLREQKLVECPALTPQDRMTILNSYGMEQVIHFYLTPPYWTRLSAMME